MSTLPLQERHWNKGVHKEREKRARPDSMRMGGKDLRTNRAVKGNRSFQPYREEACGCRKIREEARDLSVSHVENSAPNASGRRRAPAAGLINRGGNTTSGLASHVLPWPSHKK